MLFYRQRCNEVRHNYVSVLLFSSMLWAFAIIDFIFHHSYFGIFPIIGSIIFIIACIREKMSYNDDGITFCDIWGRKYPISWNDVLSIEDTFDDPCRSRGAPGQIVIIVYRNNKNKIEMKKYSYTNTVGLSEFLSFYYSQIKK